MIRCVIMACALLAFSQALAQENQPDFRFAANRVTHKYIHDTVHHELKFDRVHREFFPMLEDSEILSLLREGKVDAASVFLPTASTTGTSAANPRTNLLPEGAIVHPIGRVGAYILAPAERNLKQLTVEQVADILAGKITKWDQLNAGTGELLISYDDAAVTAACRACRIDPPAKAVFARWELDSSNGRSAAGRLLKSAAAARESHPAEGEKHANRLVIASGVSLFEQGYASLLVPIVTGSKVPSVAPTRETVQDGSYPLAVSWRVVVRPDAPQTVKGAAKLCVREYEGSLVNAHYVKEWLIPPSVAEQPNVIRIFYYGGKSPIKEVAGYYAKAHSEVNFTDASTVERSLAVSFAQSSDILVVVGTLFDDDRQKIDQLCGGAPAEYTIGRKPVLLLVSHDCPLSSLSLEQTRRVAKQDLTAWKYLGWDCEEYVVKRACGSKLLGDSLFGGYAAMLKYNPQPPTPGAMSLPFRPEGHTKEELMNERSALRKYRQTNPRSEADMLKAAATDPYSLTFVAAGQSALASGLKILKIGADTSSACGPSPDAVVSGAYPVTLQVSVLVNPKASPAAKDFAAWLQSPQAAKVLAEHYIYSKALEHDKPAGTATTLSAMQPYKGAIAGAVSILPPEVLNPYILTVKESHLAAYEDAIYSAIAADNRLKIVNRDELRKIWRERQYALLSGESEFTSAVSADIFAAPAVVLAGSSSKLRIQFFHGPTASLLYEMTMPINPSDPAQFDPPLQHAVGVVWQQVLARLAQAQTRPRWTVLGIYSATEEAMAQADAVESTLQATLAKDDCDVFLSQTLDLEAAQQETLMAMMGTGRPVFGSFTAEADFLLEGMVIDGRVELRVLEGRKLSQVAEGAFAVEDDRHACEWLSLQAKTLKPFATSTALAPADNWRSKQARLEYDIADRLAKELASRRREAEDARIKEGREKLLDEEAKVLQDLGNSRKKHLIRAVQLNPNDENIIRTYASALNDSRMSFHQQVRLAQMFERLGKQFPKSARHREAMEYAFSHYATVIRALSRSKSDWLEVPRGVDHVKLRLLYLEKLLALYEDYATRYAGNYNDPKEKRGSWSSFSNWMSHYVYFASVYVHLSKADDEQREQMIKRWSGIMDSHPAAGPHSDFLRLRFVAVRNDRSGFLTILNQMQSRHPDPNEPYWANGASIVQQDLYRLFRHGTGNCNFDKWRNGKRGIGGLPYDGYDPAKDKSEPAAMNMD